MTPLVIEYHYQDHDVGVHPVTGSEQPEAKLWNGFSEGHPASHILIREDSDDGQLLSDSLLMASMFRSVDSNAPCPASISIIERLALLTISNVGFAREASGSILGLIEKGLVERRPNGYCHLTDRGFDSAQAMGEALLSLVTTTDAKTA
jgi:hypothetical protein